MSNHIILFLKESTNVDFASLINKMQESYKELGEGKLTKNKINNPNLPNFIFQNNKDIQIDGNNHHISINIYNDYVNIKENIIEMLWDAFDYLDLEFIRVGYIKELQSDSSNIDKIQESLLTSSIAQVSDEFQVAYHQTIKFERKNTNCWKRFIKFYNTPLLISYDINTKEDNIKDINYKLLKEFIRFSDKYIDEDLKNITKENEI